jgi:predicted Zn finger-like uncharacterized protein
MRTTCPTCDTAYTIPDERIGAKGRKVRCTRCGGEWRAFLAVEAEAPPAPKVEAAAPDATPPPAADPFDALVGVDEIAFDDPLATPPDEDFGFAVNAAAPTDAMSAAGMADAADHDHDHESVAAPTSTPARRINIRTKRRFPKIGKETFARAAAGIRPFVGPAVFLAACLTVTGVYVFRQAIVAASPDLAGLYAALGAPVNLRGLVFGRIETLREIDNGQPVLVVEGSIANVTRQMREVPALRFALRGSDTQELYAWSIDPKSTTIESGDTIRFRTRLAAPPDQAADVQVRFVERRSQHAGLP